MLHRECRWCVQRAREIQRLVPQDRWDTDAIMTQTRSSSGPHSNPSVAVRRCTSTEGKNPKQDINWFGATIGCPSCNAIRDNKRAQAHSDRCRIRIEERLRTTPQGAERLDRRDEVINEALPEEVRREEQKRRRSDRAAAEVQETESSSPAASPPRENPIEPDPNPKRRLIMKSASTTASGSGQERE